jgi:hypothetical protein
MVRMALWTRSEDSLTALSGRPTMMKRGWPAVSWESTSMGDGDGVESPKGGGVDFGEHGW